MTLLNVGTVIVTYLVTTTALCLYLKSEAAAAAAAAVVTKSASPAATSILDITIGNLAATSLLFFNNLNILIAICEIALGKHIAKIKSDYLVLKKKYGGGNEWEGCVAFLTKPLHGGLGDAFKLDDTWSWMWSTYALYDPSYQNTEAFGFFIDVGNGWSTIPPGLLMNYAIIYGPYLLPITEDSSIITPLLVGCIGIASYWQIMYGTYIYFLSFVWNERYKGFAPLEIWTFVGLSNGIWILFPAIGLWACYRMLGEGSFDVLA